MSIGQIPGAWKNAVVTPVLKKGSSSIQQTIALSLRQVFIAS